MYSSTGGTPDALKMEQPHDTGPEITPKGRAF